MRFNAPEHLQFWKDTGRFPAIHDDIMHLASSHSPAHARVVLARLLVGRPRQGADHQQGGCQQDPGAHGLRSKPAQGGRSEGADARRTSERTFALAPLPLGTDQQADAQGDRQVKQNRTSDKTKHGNVVNGGGLIVALSAASALDLGHGSCADRGDGPTSMAF